METSQAWSQLFENWPDSIPREGMIVTRFQETIPFKNFMISSGLLLVERESPDSVGARKVILGYDGIMAVKIANPMDLVRFQVMGFQVSF